MLIDMPFRNSKYDILEQLDISDLIASEIWNTIRFRYNQDGSSNTTTKINNM